MGVRTAVRDFRHPLTVVADYAGQMAVEGLFPRSDSTGGSSHSEATEFAEERAGLIRRCITGASV